MKIALAARFEDCEREAWLEALAQACPGARWVTEFTPAERFEVAVVANPPPGALHGLAGLRLIQSLWAGVERLLADPTLPRDVPLARMVDPEMTAAMAQTALWATLALHRGFFGYALQQRQARWRQHAQRRADELRVLVLGQGELGRAVTAALAAQGYAVAGWRRGAVLEPLLAGSEIVINLLPLTESTRGLLNAALFAALPRGAKLVNLARGAHLVEADLLAALDSGALAHAVLDVFETEPLPPQHPFWQHPHVTVLPHVAALTDPRSAAERVAENIVRVMRGQQPLHLVDRTRGY